MNLSNAICHAVRTYLHDCQDGLEHRDLYHLVIKEVEMGLFQEVLRHCNGNQTQASKILGLSLSTLRRRVSTYKIIGD